MNKAVQKRIGRMKNNLGLSERRDELINVQGIDQRNQKVISAINTYRKNISNCIKTGLREEVLEKRKKKCEEFALAADLTTDAKELELNNSTCLAKVLRHIQVAVNKIMDERVQSEIKLEKRVLDGLQRYVEQDKALAKAKERLSHTYVDVEIARKALSSKHVDEAKAAELQDDFDSHTSKMESLKDSTMTDIFTLAAKEQDIAIAFSAYVEELLEYHRYSTRILEDTLPEIRREIANARPRPIFSVDLEEHLRHTNRPIAVVLEKCCGHLRASGGMREKGVFRINGNNTKIRRMKAAFDAGQIDDEMILTTTDPHSVCSVLKSYLRELPDPLLTNRLHTDWVAATKMEGEERLEQVEHCLAQLPVAYHNNLAYLVNFLCELLLYEKITMMNAGNLAIVFGPNLVGNGNETDNVTGSKIVETLLLNEERFFANSPYYQKHTVQSVGSAISSLKESQGIMRVNSTPYGRPSGKLVATQRQFFDPHAGTPGALSIDTHSSLRASTKSLSHSPMDMSGAPHTIPNAGFSHSPKSIHRPRITAPLPPPPAGSPPYDIADYLDIGSGSSMSRSVYTPPNATSVRGHSSTMSNQQPSLNEVMESLNALRADREPPPQSPSNRVPSRDSSFDSMDELDDDALTRSLERPLRPPPPFRGNAAISVNAKNRPMSYNMAVGNSSSSQPPQQQSFHSSQVSLIDLTEPEAAIITTTVDAPSHRANPSEACQPTPSATVISTSTSTISTSGPIHRSIVSIEGPVPTARVRPPLPTKPGRLSEPESPNAAQQSTPPPLTTTQSGTAPLQPKESTKL